jgi:hypothetical protein
LGSLSNQNKPNQTKPKVFINLENQAQTRTKGSSIYEIKTKTRRNQTQDSFQKSKNQTKLVLTIHITPEPSV